MEFVNIRDSNLHTAIEGEVEQSGVNDLAK